MPEAHPSIISHVSFGTNSFDKAVTFYDRVLASLGINRVMEHPAAVAYGRTFPEFWVQRPLNGEPASAGNGSHVGFLAESREAVDAFHAVALAAGATDDGAPGPRLEYGAGYYGCFLRDLDGNKIEAMYWDTGA